MKICCWINFEMHFKSNSDSEQAFSKTFFRTNMPHYTIRFDLITKVTEVSVFLLVEENFIEPVKGGNENQY